MGTISQKKVTSALKKIISSFPEQGLTAAQKSMTYTSNIGTEILKNIRIPIVTSDEEIIAYVKEFELDKPENFIRYLVEASYAPADAICNSINDLKEENLKECISIIRSQKEIYLRRLEKNRDLDVIFDKLCEVSDKLEDKIKIYINAIQRIDNRTKWEAFINAKTAIKEVDANVSLAKIAIDSYVRANNLYMVIASQCGEDYALRLQKYETFMDTVLLQNGICRLMHGYDKNKTEEFWFSIEDLKKQVYIISEIASDVQENIEDFDENDIDFS